MLNYMYCNFVIKNMISTKRKRSQLVNLHSNKRYNMFIFFLFIVILFGYTPTPTFSATDHQVLDDKLLDYMREHVETTSGVATIVINGDKTIYKMQGYADKEQQTPVNKDTVFEWGSISKILIWISVLQLMEQERLDLEEDISTYLPDDFHTKTSFDEPVTLKHLMNHTAGFDDSYTDLMLLHPSERSSLRKVLEEANIKQVSLPSEMVAYSNYGASLAAYIVEEIIGRDVRE